MKILSISSIPLLPHLGSGKTRLHWTTGLRQLGHEVEVLEPNDFEIFQFTKKAKKYRQAVGIWLKIKKLMKQNTYDIIEFYGDEYWLMLHWIKKRKQKCPLLIAHADGVELYDMHKAQTFWGKKTGLKKWLFDIMHYRFSKRTFSLADYLVCGCNDDLQYMIQHKYFLSQQAVCIAPGIEESFHAIPFQEVKENIICYIGSWIGRKGVALIPLVINEILKSNPQYAFHIFGAGISTAVVLENFNLAVRSRVVVFDKMPLYEMQQRLQKAAIFFMPTYSEGFGLATVEAMSCSCVAVTTPTGIGKELSNNKEAIICNFNDTASMIRSIQLLIDNDEQRKLIAYKGWQKAKEYVWPNQIKKLEAQYFHWYRLNNPQPLA